MKIFKQIAKNLKLGITTSLKVIKGYQKHKKALKTKLVLQNIEKLNLGVKSTVNTIKQFHYKTKIVYLIF